MGLAPPSDAPEGGGTILDARPNEAGANIPTSISTPVQPVILIYLRVLSLENHDTNHISISVRYDGWNIFKKEQDTGRTIERAAYAKQVPSSIVILDVRSIVILYVAIGNPSLRLHQVHKPYKYLIRPLTPACPDQYSDARPTAEPNRRKNELMAKSSWPEVVGWPQLNAADQINIDRPDVTDVGFYKQGSPLPSGYNPKRVVIISDDNGVVLKTPVIG
ncbi:hypothetical protein D1007_24222 [Hordeum vulgare]|nr:hypothetical protein D1007_24222 [Hordeum vulgare]